FAPLRLASKEKILENLRRLSRQTGYEEISLLSLSSSDHPDICGLVDGIMTEFKGRGVSVSLPSLRARHLVGGLSQMLSTMRKTTLTFAPEAGTQRLRSVIRKDLDVEELFGVAADAFRAGYRFLKLYFMIGLPTEEEEDLRGIEELCRRLIFLKKGIDGRPAQLTVSISNFVPKPHTPFQWQAMATVEEIRSKQEYLKKAFGNLKGRAKLRFHNPEMSYMESLFSRGDRRLSSVILGAYQRGARFDAWEEGFQFGLWQEAFDQSGLDPVQYLRARSMSESLPWDFIDVGVAMDYLRQEACLALEGCKKH
ncbi:MAG: B12-binding domain-containing radical SAM protein, partial [Candidatus Omnitrophota bacterium]